MSYNFDKSLKTSVARFLSIPVLNVIKVTRVAAKNLVSVVFKRDGKTCSTFIGGNALERAVPPAKITWMGQICQVSVLGEQAQYICLNKRQWTAYVDQAIAITKDAGLNLEIVRILSKGKTEVGYHLA